MSFQTISVKEAVNNINANNNGWFLPAVQRQYVWGSRYESEKYICKLFDSILNGYPIGTLIVWNTDLAVPYREFMKDYEDGKTEELAVKSTWDRPDKWLVYDGQQRLQTLYSCLKYTLNKRELAYNLLYKANDVDEEYGFEFLDKNTEKAGYVTLPSLFSKSDSEKVSFRRRLQAELQLTDEEEELFESRFDKLWSVFVGSDVKSLAYFPIDKSWNEDKVNDVFQRLNTGGVPLSGADLLFSRIKGTAPLFEEKLIEISQWISEVTNGYLFSANEILQLIHLIVKGSTRIDPSRINESELKQFVDVGERIGDPLKEFFGEFIYKGFNINNSAIVSRKRAVLPLIVYTYLNYCNNKRYKDLSSDNVTKMKQYFIISQLNDWNTQGIVEGGTREIKGDNFPLDKFKKIAKQKNRVVDLNSEALENNEWFTLKIMLPNRLYVKQENTTGRYKPELDHIFPVKLANQQDDYKKEVDVLWNLQPVAGKTNLIKSNTHPLKFFTDVNTKSHKSEYDFLPDDIISDEWDNYKLFISKRKTRMINFLKENYSLEISE